MEFDTFFYLIVYLVIIVVFILFILSPFSLYLSLKLSRIYDITKKKTLLISLALAVPCLGLLSLPDIFEWTSWSSYLSIMIVTLYYCVFMLYIVFKTPFIKSIGLSLSYGFFNILLIFLCLFLLSLISRDQPLDPEAKELLDNKPATVAESDNLYYALIGFSAEPDVNPHQAGLQCIKEFNEYTEKIAVAQKKGTPMPPIPACFSPEFSASAQDLDNLCAIAKPDWLECFRTEQGQFDSLIQKYEYLIDYYMALSHYAGYDNAGMHCLITPAIRFSPIYSAHKLFIAKTALNYFKGQRSESIEKLVQDMRFQCQNLGRSDDLLFTMLAVSSLTRDVDLYSQLLDQDIAKIPFPQTLEIPLLSDKERDLTKALQGYFQITGSLLRSPNSDIGRNLSKGFPGFFQEIFFKPNATINHFFYFHKKMIEWSQLPAEKLQSSKVKTPPLPGFWDVGYNPQGTILFTISMPMPNFDSFIYRLHNLDGLIRLVKIKQRIRYDRIAKNQIEAFLKQDLPYFKNPYTNQSMSWDSKNDILFFNSPLCEGQRIEIKIPFLLNN